MTDANRPAKTVTAPYVRYATQDDWDKVRDVLTAVLRVADHMPEGHHRESIRNLIKSVHVLTGVGNNE